MFRFDRLLQRLSPLWVTASLLHLGCTLITDVDRSKIPEPATIEPDPVPPSDAGPEQPELTDAGAAGDAAAAADATPDATPAEPELDAGAIETPDAQ
jgi:hypothetical protein